MTIEHIHPAPTVSQDDAFSDCARLNARIAQLEYALAECITDQGAAGYLRPGLHGRNRLKAINKTAREALIAPLA